MKLLKKIKNNRNKVVLLLATTVFMSCSEYLDVNNDTDTPSIAPLNQLLTNTQVNLNNATDFNNFSASILSVYTHQTTAREEQDQYGTRVDNLNLQNEWDNIYLTLTDIETLIKQGTESGDMVYVGVAQMEKAYLMSIAVDLWGDVPYSEVGKLKEGIVSPKFDDQREIYNSLFSLIETAKTNIASDLGIKKPGGDDLIYGGSTAKWIRFANTFKLKLYNQTRLASGFDQAGFNALIAANNFMTSNADDFQFIQTSNISPTDERNKYFVESYTSTQFGSYQSPWFYEILKGMNPNIHNNNPDPRIKYYFFNQLTAGQFPPNTGDVATGNPRADYWDKSTGFFSIRFGSIGPWRDSSAEDSYTYPGIFPTGGRYDDGLGGNINKIMAKETGQPTAPLGKAPHRMLTYDEFLFIQAELIQVGKLTGNASMKLNQAVDASFAKVDQVVDNSGTTQTVPNLVGNAAVNTFVTKLMAEFTAASAAKKLEIIMTQKWVATYGDPFDQYNDYRRTGFPVLANPLGASPEYQLNNTDGFPIIDSQTVQNNPYQVSLFWPQSELNANQNAPAQKNAGTYKIFWDN